jgi:hypothetical protein
MQRKVGGIKSEVLKEGLLLVVFLVQLQACDGVVYEGYRGVVFLTLGDMSLEIIFFPTGCGEVTVVTRTVVLRRSPASVKAIVRGLAIEVPLAGMVGLVAVGFEQVGQELRPFRALAPLDIRDEIALHLLRIVPCQECCPTWPATTRRVVLRELQSASGKPVDVWRVDFSTITTRIGEAHVIGKDEEHVGSGVFFGDGISVCGERQNDHKNAESGESFRGVPLGGGEGPERRGSFRNHHTSGRSGGPCNHEKCPQYSRSSFCILYTS